MSAQTWVGDGLWCPFAWPSFSAIFDSPSPRPRISQSVDPGTQSRPSGGERRQASRHLRRPNSLCQELFGFGTVEQGQVVHVFEFTNAGNTQGSRRRLLVNYTAAMFQSQVGPAKRARSAPSSTPKYQDKVRSGCICSPTTRRRGPPSCRNMAEILRVEPRNWIWGSGRRQQVRGSIQVEAARPGEAFASSESSPTVMRWPRARQEDPAPGAATIPVSLRDGLYGMLGLRALRRITGRPQVKVSHRDLGNRAG